MPQSNTLSKNKITVDYPHWYSVKIHNDDVTTMEFVVEILHTIFYKSMEDATQLMLQVHYNGSANIGLYSYDVATSKTQRAIDKARSEGFPLRITIEQNPDIPF